MRLRIRSLCLRCSLSPHSLRLHSRLRRRRRRIQDHTGQYSLISLRSQSRKIESGYEKESTRKPF